MTVLLAALASILLAHGDTGRLELVDRTPAGETAVRYVAELADEGDGDLVSRTEFTVAATGTGTPSRAIDALGNGRDEATVDFEAHRPRDVAVSVDEPAALAGAQIVDATTTTTSERTRDDVAEEASGAWWLLIVMSAFVVAMIVVAVAFFRGRASASSDPSR